MSNRRKTGWLAARAADDDSVHTQGRSLNEVIANIREVAELRNGDTDVQVELVVPSTIKVA